MYKNNILRNNKNKPLGFFSDPSVGSAADFVCCACRQSHHAECARQKRHDGVSSGTGKMSAEMKGERRAGDSLSGSSSAHQGASRGGGVAPHPEKKEKRKKIPGAGLDECNLDGG